MPNCDFLAIGSDLQDVLGYVFGSGEFVVYESYSEPDCDLREFAGLSEVLSANDLGVCKGTASSVLLQLVAKGTGHATIERFALDPAKCGGKTFRYRAAGWGLIQLYMGGIGQKGIVASHTNHNSETRAYTWEPTYPELPAVGTWDWKGIQSASGKLNRYVRKRAVYKQGSRPVLPEAAAYLAQENVV